MYMIDFQSGRKDTLFLKYGTISIQEIYEADLRSNRIVLN